MDLRNMLLNDTQIKCKHFHKHVRHPGVSSNMLNTSGQNSAPASGIGDVGPEADNFMNLGHARVLGEGVYSHIAARGLRESKKDLAMATQKPQVTTVKSMLSLAPSQSQIQYGAHNEKHLMMFGRN